MFITKDELDKRLDSAINLNNILNPEDRIEQDKSAQADKDIKRVLEGVVLNEHGGQTRPLGRQGKAKGDENIPQMFRDIITAQAVLGEPSKSLQKNWGVSQSEVSNLKNGIPNRANPESAANKSAQDIIAKVTGRIRDKICDRIEQALDSMTPERFAEEQSLKTLSTITSNLARTAQALESKDKDKPLANLVQTIIYAPAAAEVNEYTTLEVAR